MGPYVTWVKYPLRGAEGDYGKGGGPFPILLGELDVASGSIWNWVPLSNLNYYSKPQYHHLLKIRQQNLVWIKCDDALKGLALSKCSIKVNWYHYKGPQGTGKAL